MADFGRQYGITFRDPGLLKLALTHRSYLHVTGQGPRESNERLEFLGDSVLGLVTSEFLYRSHPGEHEGQLTKTKSLLVSKAILSRRALAMGLGRFVLMSHSEVESGGRQRLSILADGFEAVIGAIYLDQGFEAARGFIERWLLKESRVIAADKRHTNYKSHLQEYVQSTFRTHPVYRIRSEMGPDHSKQFMVEVMVGRRLLGEGRGPNKKEAEQAAARNALEAVEKGPLSDRETRRVERVGPTGGTAAEPGRAPATAAPESAGAAVGGEAVDERWEGRGRRRRGRRGGRGRRERGELPMTGPEAAGMGGVSPPAPPRGDRVERGESAGRPEAYERPERPEGPERPEWPERRERIERRERPERPDRAAGRIEPPRGIPLPPPVARPTELEPLPPASEEDDNEEVGRPEGPQDEWHVDPFGSRTPGASVEPERVITPSTPAVGQPEAAAPPRVMPEPEPTVEAEMPEPPRDETEESAVSEEAAEGSGALGDDEEEGPRYPETGPPPPPPPAPTWGRRGRRGR
jgi:ribonuclease-3